MNLSEEEKKELKGKGFILSKDGEHFAARILSENGTATSEQLRALADAADRFGMGTVSFTSRLSVEMPGVSLENVEPLSDFLADHGLETGGTGPKIRPVTCCKGTVCVHGLIDTQALAKELHEKYYKGWHDIKLPAKFKIAVGGCPNNCAKPNLNDFGIIGWTRKDEQGRRVPAYKITIGGIWGKTQRIGTPIDGVFTKEQVFDILDHTLKIWMQGAKPGERLGHYLDRIERNGGRFPFTPEWNGETSSVPEMELLHGAPEDMTGRQEREIRAYEFLDRVGVEFDRTDHPDEPATSMEVCARIDAVLNVRICKNLFLCNRQKTAFYLLVMPGDKPFKTKELSGQLGISRLSFADEEHMKEYLDLLPGSVSVLGLMNDKEHKVRLVIDEDVLKEEMFGCHPCMNTSSIRFRTKDLTEKILPALHVTYDVVHLVGLE